MACGTGKTMVELWVREDLDAQRTVVFVPSIALLDQFASEWRRQADPGKPYAALCVCSDGTVGQRTADSLDEAYFTTADLEEDGFDVTSDAARIAEFMKRPGRQVIFSTYQSSHLIEEAQRDPDVPAFDLAIGDEAHRVAGDEQSVFATVLDADRIRARKRLFATATPRIYRTGRGADDSAVRVDMNDEARFGPRLHTLPMGAAIEQGLLSDYRVVIMHVSDPEVDALLKSASSADDKARARLAVHVAVLKAVRENGLQRVISFHSRVQGAAQFARDLPAVAAAMWPEGEALRPVADHVSGEMPAQERKRKLEQLRRVDAGQFNVLTNARCLTEGVDVPDVDGIAFVDPKSGSIDIIQALGRAIRKHEDKEYGTIILPVFIGKGQTLEEVIANTDYKPVIEVLSALRAHDAEFETALIRWRQAEGSGGGGGDPLGKIRIVGGEHVQGLAEAIRPIMLEELTDGFWEKLGVLQAFHEKHGHCRVPRRATWPEDDPQGVALGNWVQNLRQSRKAGTLSADKVAALDALGFVWDVLAEEFNAKRDMLQAFHEKHGHCRVPDRATWPEDDPQGYPLGRAVAGFRKSRKAGTLSADQVAALDDLGFVWDPLAEEFEEKRGMLQAFHEKHGHCRVPRNATWPEDDPQGVALGRWVVSLRQSRKAGTLSADRVAALDDLGFVWDPLAEEFEEKRGMLQAFHEKHGHCRVPDRATWPEDDPQGYPLGRAVAGFRKSRKAGTLSADQVAALDDLGFVWDPLAEEFEEKRGMLQAFHEKHGHCRVPDRATWQEDDPQGYPLGRAVAEFRKSRKAGTLSADQVAALDDLGFVWDAKNTPTPTLPVSTPTSDLPLEVLVDRLKDEENSPELIEQMVRFGCDPDTSRELLASGSFDEALEHLEEATGEPLQGCKVR